MRSHRPPLIRRATVAVLVAASLARAQGAPAGAVRPKAVPVPTGEPWTIIALPQSSLVYARDGSLIGEIGRQWRTSIALRTLPKYVHQAFVAVEDHRFYQHDGVDMVGVAGAIKGKMLGQARGGASTITQQLVGNLHPDQIDRRDMSPLRKLREQRAAREMEKHYNKEQILEAYRFLAQEESVFCEPASAASVAGLLTYGLPDGLGPGSTVVCVLTGHGLKDPDIAISQIQVPTVVDATLPAVLDELGLA